jgi:1,4-dihydroxy-6-naphthoate synthase
MKLSLGFSPCPNDTFIFDAMIHQKIDTEGLEFEVLYEDVETLNQKAFKNELDITKLSYHAYAHLCEHYVLLHSGSALGFGVGPLLICKNEDIAQAFEINNSKDSLKRLNKPIEELRIGIPGKYTTANFLLRLAIPDATNKQEMKFFEIESALINQEIDLGVIIHENRFTYQEKGLLKIIDLGEFWENLTHGPIPLGGIMIKRNIQDDIKHKVNRIIKRSVQYAFDHPTSGLDFICSLSQEMSKDVVNKHIELYVNQFSLDLGDVGRKAVETFFEHAQQVGIIPQTKQNLFL